MSSDSALRPPELEDIHVLILEDSRTMTAILRELLRGVGVKNASSAVDVASAFEEIRTKQPDLALVDYELEDVNGVEFTSLLRTASDSPAPDLPVVICTAHGERAVVQAALAAGADSFIIKPVSANVLAQRMCAAIRKRRGESEALRKAG